MDKQYMPVPDVEALRYKGTPEKPDIKIFVAHRIDQESAEINSPFFIPVRCGAVYDARENVSKLGDNTGENVSEKRMSYCELTVQYWAWKNVKADYYGLCHYRRYLSFANKRFPESIQNLAIFDSLSTESQRLCGLLDEQAICNKVKEYDITVSQKFNVGHTVTPGGASFKTVKDYWYKGWGEFLIKKENLDLLFELIIKRYPSYKKDLNELLNQAYFRGYNCFVMKAKPFHELCEFEFGLMEEIEPLLDMEGASNYRNRTLGYFAEILYTLWIYRAIKYKLYTVNERQLVLFQDSSKAEALQPKDEKCIPVVFNATVHDMHVLHPVVKSIIANVSPDKKYEIIVLVPHNSDFGKRERRQKELLTSLAASKDNVFIRFLDPKEQLAECDLRENLKQQCPEQEVYKLLLPWILEKYQKAVYLNSLSIVNADIADLFDIDLHEKAVGAVRDVFYNGSFYNTKSVQQHAQKNLQGHRPEDYFDIDVMLFDLSHIRNQYSKNDAIKMHWSIGKTLSTNDAVNLFYADDIHHISPAWNYLEWCDESFAQITKWADELVEKEYSKVKNPYIRNFKFWNNLIDSWFAYDFWQYARETPVYENLISMMADTKANRISTLHELIQAGHFDNRTGIRKLADKIMPHGSLRRKLAKKIMPRDSFIWKVGKRIYYIFKPEYRPTTTVIEDGEK